MDRVLKFYRDVLDLDVLDQFTVSGEVFSTGVGIEGATGTFVHLDANGACIELVEYDPEDDDASTERLNQPGTKHLGLAVDDLDHFYETLPPDADTLSEPQTTESGTRILFLRDPEDNLVELIEAEAA